jgi:hypothetical protein
VRPSRDEDRSTALNPFLEFGMCSEQVARFLNAFPWRRVGIFLYDDFASSPERVVRSAHRLLGIRDDVPLDLSRRYNESRVPRSRTLERVARSAARLLGHVLPDEVRGALRRLRYRSRASVEMKPEDRRFLIDYYARDVERLARLVDRDLSAWLEAWRPTTPVTSAHPRALEEVAPVPWRPARSRRRAR